MKELTESLLLLVNAGFIPPKVAWRIIKEAIHVKYGIGYLYLDEPSTVGRTQEGYTEDKVPNKSIKE